MKKSMLVALILIFTLSTLASMCAAAAIPGMANTSKMGSLVVWPLVKIGPEKNQDTILTLNNDYGSYVHLICCYKYPAQEGYGDNQCLSTCRDFSLTAYQEVAWSAKTGLDLEGNAFFGKPGYQKMFPFGRDSSTDPVTEIVYGELKCWAVDESTNYPIKYNYLSGTAIIGEGDNQTWQYSAYRHAAGRNFKAPTSKTLSLTGSPKDYDACPSGLLFNFIEQDNAASGSTPFQIKDATAGDRYRTAHNVLTLVPCKQDMVGDNNTRVLASMAIRNENEQSGSATACIGCGESGPSNEFFTGSLRDGVTFSTYGPFIDLLGYPSGSLLVTTSLVGVSDTGNCSIERVSIPLYGVMSIQTHSLQGPVAGETPTLVGPPQGYILDDTGAQVKAVEIHY